MADRFKKAVRKLARKKKTEEAPAQAAVAEAPPAPKPVKHTAKKAAVAPLSVIPMGEDINIEKKKALMEAINMFDVSMKAGKPLPLQWLVDTLTTGEVKDVEEYL